MRTLLSLSTPSTLNAKTRPEMKKKYRILFFLIGLAGIAVLIIRTKPGKEDWERLITPQLPFLLLGLLLLWAVIFMLHARAYRLVIGPDSGNLKPVELYRICVSGFALNDVTPLGLAGGEPYRIMELKRYLGVECATSVTLTFSVLYIIGHVLLWLTGILIYLIYGCPGEPFMTGFLIFIMLILGFVCYVFFNHKNSGIVLPVLRRLSKIPFLKKRIDNMMDSRREQLQEIDSGYVSFRNVSDRFSKAVLCEYASRLLEGVEYFIIFRYLGESVSPIDGILILSMASLIGNLLFIVPMQAGAREGGTALAVDWIGVDPAIGIIGGLIYRMRNIACIIIGIICILIAKDTPKAKDNS